MSYLTFTTMKKFIILFFLCITTSWARKRTSQPLESQIAVLKKQNALLRQELQFLLDKQQSMLKRQKSNPVATKQDGLFKKSLTGFVSGIWDVLITHLKRWYIALLLLIVIWYKANLPFPWRDEIAKYFNQ